MVVRLCILLCLLSLVEPVTAGEVSGSVTVSTREPVARNRNRSREAVRTQKKLYGKQALKKAVPGSEKDGGLTRKQLDEVNEVDYVLVYVTEEKDGAKLPATAGKATLAQRGRVFHNHVTPVVLGSTVTFTNEDRFTHDIYTPKRSVFKVGEHGRGESADRTADVVGPFELFCNIHTLMNAYIYVVPNDFYALAQGGKYTFKALPPGTYEIKAWHPRLGEKTETVKVGQSPVTVNFYL